MQATGEDTTASTPAPVLSQLTIFRFFSPLALSWIFMSIESPVSLALIGRLPNDVVSAAAFQVMMALALWIESPVIDLLATSTTLTKNRQNYLQIQRFTLWLIGMVTLAHAIFVFTPVYTFVAETLMGVPKPVADDARLGLAVMLPWSGFIGWRRFLQGILIRNAKTRLVGVGTAIRVGAMFAAGFLLYFTTKLPSIQIAAIALITAVGAESMYAHWASRETIRRSYARDEGGEPVALGKLVRFHLPLTGTTMIVMIALPVVSMALAQTPDSVAQLAGYQTAFSLVWLMRTTVYAVPEVVITLYKDEQSAAALKSFSLRLGLITSGIMLAVWLLRLDILFYRYILRANPAVLDIAHLAFIAPVLTPLIGAMQNYVRGMLTAHHLTVSRLLAIGISMAVLVLTLFVTIALKINDVLTVGICMTLSMAAELAVLAIALRLALRRNVHSAVPV